MRRAGPISSGEKLGRKYMNVLEPNSFRYLGSKPSLESRIRRRCIWNQPNSTVGSFLDRYQAPRWKNAAIMTTAMSIARMRST
jgi:hypothetical protein